MKVSTCFALSSHFSLSSASFGLPVVFLAQRSAHSPETLRAVVARLRQHPSDAPGSPNAGQPLVTRAYRTCPLLPWTPRSCRTRLGSWRRSPSSAAPRRELQTTSAPERDLTRTFIDPFRQPLFRNSCYHPSTRRLGSLRPCHFQARQKTPGAESFGALQSCFESRPPVGGWQWKV